MDKELREQIDSVAEEIRGRITLTKWDEMSSLMKECYLSLAKWNLQRTLEVRLDEHKKNCQCCLSHYYAIGQLSNRCNREVEVLNQLQQLKDG